MIRGLLAAPTFTLAMGRGAYSLNQAGHHRDAVALARRALSIAPSSVESKAALAIVLSSDLADAGGINSNPMERGEAVTLGRDASTNAPKDIDVQLALCEVLAATQQTADDIKLCAAYVIHLAPDEPEAYMFAALAAGMAGDRDAAYEHLETVERLGFDEGDVKRLRTSIDDSEPRFNVYGKRILLGFALWVVSLIALFFVGGALSKLTLRLVDHLSPNPNTRSQELVGAPLLRAVYRAVLGIASVYYYLSLPLAFLSAVLSAVAVILGFVYIGRVPIVVVGVAGTVILATMSSAWKSLRSRAILREPGILVDRATHAKLWKVVRAVADRVGTRPVDRIYLTPNANISVLERGSMLGLLMRISQGASRLQEVMADRIAAFAYGPEAFVSGLNHMVRRGVIFDAYLKTTTPISAEEIEEAVTAALEKKPSPYASHPRPVDRIAWVRRLSAADGVWRKQSTREDRDVWDLFADRREIEERMTVELRAVLAEQGMVIDGP